MAVTSCPCTSLFKLFGVLDPARPLATHVRGYLLALFARKGAPVLATGADEEHIWAHLLSVLGQSTKAYILRDKAGSSAEGVIVLPPAGEDGFGGDCGLPSLFIHSDTVEDGIPLLGEAVRLVRETYGPGLPILFPAIDARWGPPLAEFGLPCLFPPRSCRQRRAPENGVVGSKTSEQGTSSDGLELGVLRAEDLSLILSHNELQYSPRRFLPLITLSPCVRSFSQEHGAMVPVSWCLISNDLAICALQTLPDYRGKGLAGRVVNAALTTIRQAGLDHPHSTHFSDNSQGSGFFDGSGWEDVGEVLWWRSVL